MPLTSFLGLVAAVILAAGLSLVLAFHFGLPLSVIAFVALAASFALSLRQWR